jgi:rod shape-determining protein MreD
MLRKIILAATILIFYLLQTTLFKSVALASVSPNLFIILTVAAGFMRGKREGLYVGFFCGLMLDLYYGQVIGFQALLYMYIGYINGFFHNLFYDDEITLPLGLVLGSDFIYNFVYYVFRFLLRNRLDFGYYFMHIILPEMIYTIVITIFIYRIMLRVNRAVEAYERKRATKFG